MVRPATEIHDPIPSSRIVHLNTAPVRPGDCVLYRMQASQRAEDNPPLDLAVIEANRLGLPLKVRYMAASGLKRKCDIDAYVAMVAAL